jgi:uncharacterized protein (DUF2267 family)
MQYDEFLNRVQAKAAVGSRDEAVRLTEATLETLGERLYRTERENVAAQLARELERSLLKRGRDQATRRDVDRFRLADFCHRVSARSGIAHPDAVEGARVVMTVLRGAVSQGAWEELAESLPGEYKDLWEQR